MLFRQYLKCSSNINIKELSQFIKKYGGNHLTHLFFLKDKETFWAQNEKVLIVYKTIKNKAFVLGNPIGNDIHIKEAIVEFELFCQASGLRPVFYQVSPEYLSIFEMLDYKFLKIGEEPKVDLDEFSLAGKKGAKLRTRQNKFIKNGYTFKVFHPPFNDEFFSSLKSVSNSWLGNRKEKGFSVSFFNKDYVSNFSVATLYCPNGELLAFSTLAPNYKKDENTITIDLMRHKENTPHGTMDMLFLSTINWAKENGYDWCSLGMAPLANVGTATNSKLYEKVGKLIYSKCNYFYNFKGLKEFKEKYAHQWIPNYIVYKKGNVLLTIFLLMLLINYSYTTEEYVTEEMDVYLNYPN